MAGLCAAAHARELGASPVVYEKGTRAGKTVDAISLRAGVVGLVTGSLSGATGVFVIPTVPYLTSLKITSEELVQSIGVLAFVCPLALGLALAVNGQYRADAAGTSFLALFPALAGMYIGMRLRRRLAAAVFMRWFFAGLIALGGYMFLRSARLI